MAKKKRNTSFGVRWVMSPVLSKTMPGAPVRHGPAQQTTLFPAFSDAPGPKARTGSDLAPIVTGTGGCISGCPSPDCPPALPEEHGAPPYDESRTRGAAARCGAEETAPLAGL